jgi:hypothetical protein
MCALHDPDAFPPTSLGVRQVLRRLSHDGRPAAAERLVERWKLYLKYAAQHLWALLAGDAGPHPSRPPTAAPDIWAPLKRGVCPGNRGRAIATARGRGG